MTTRYERIKMQRRMQRRIQLVVEERRAAADPDITVEIPRNAIPITVRAIGRVTVRTA